MGPEGAHASDPVDNIKKNAFILDAVSDKDAVARYRQALTACEGDWECESRAQVALREFRIRAKYAKGGRAYVVAAPPTLESMAPPGLHETKLSLYNKHAVHRAKGRWTEVNGVTLSQSLLRDYYLLSGAKEPAMWLDKSGRAPGFWAVIGSTVGLAAAGMLIAQAADSASGSGGDRSYAGLGGLGIGFLAGVGIGFSIKGLWLDRRADERFQRSIDLFNDGLMERLELAPYELKDP